MVCASDLYVYVDWSDNFIIEQGNKLMIYMPSTDFVLDTLSGDWLAMGCLQKLIRNNNFLQRFFHI